MVTPQVNHQKMTRARLGWAIGLDPGQRRCGLACSDASQQQVAWGLICTPQDCWERLRHWWLHNQSTCLYLGDGTFSTRWRTDLLTWWPAQNLQLVPESYTSLEARRRYWQVYPPQGWHRCLPEGLRQPPRPVDDLAALVILERGLGHSLICHSKCLGYQAQTMARTRKL